MWKIRGLIEFVDPQAFDPGYRPSSHNQRPDCARLVGTDHNHMELAETCKCRAACFHPCILVHGAVGILAEELPAAGLGLDRAEVLDNPHGRVHIIETST